MFDNFWKPISKHRSISPDHAWMLRRDGAWRVILIRTGEVFTYDNYGELMFDLLTFGQSVAGVGIRDMHFPVANRAWMVAL
jgi:hypothetical protein